MASSFWIFLGIVIVVGIISDTVVKIIKAAKSGGGKFGVRVEDLEEVVNDLEQDLGDARQRIEVLEKIVTDQKYDLGREIDGLNEAKS